MTQPNLILTLTNDPDTCALLNDLLRSAGFSLLFAETTQESLALAEKNLPTAILLDTTPTLNPLETCRRIRANHLLAGLPVLMLTQRSERDVRAAGLSAGVDDFLEKPFDALEILARLRTLSRLNTYQVMLSDLTRFSWMVEHAQEGYLILNRAENILYANERAQSLLNLSEDYLGLPFSAIVEHLYTPQPADVWQQWAREPEPCFLVQPESPTARAVWLILEALETPGQAEYQRIVRLRDVTERMSIYQDMRRFHTVVAHKLRTPMSIMLSNLSIIKNHLNMLPPEEIRAYAQTSVQGAERLAGEIRKILSYIDAPLALNLGEAALLRDLPTLLQSICQSLGIDAAVLSMPSDLQETRLALTADALEMILHEALENARKFHPSHQPHIEISVWQAEEEHIRLRVVDDGMNLSQEQIRWAWLPYVQGEKDFTGELPGIGIGFPMVATLVWKAGGSLRLRNRPDAPGVIVEMKIPQESAAKKVQRSAQKF